MVEYGYKVKNTLIEKYKFKLDQFFIIPAPVVKMYAGKGDFTKYEMFQSFCKNNNLDKFIEKCGFRYLVANYTDKFIKINASKTKKYDLAKADYDILASNSGTSKDEQRPVKAAERELNKLQKQINEVLSPVDDMIDSYFICDYLHKILLKNIILP